MNESYTIPHMRTIREAYSEIKKEDPNTAISERYLRQIVRDEGIAIYIGNRALVDMEKLIDYLRS